MLSELRSIIFEYWPNTELLLPSEITDELSLPYSIAKDNQKYLAEPRPYPTNLKEWAFMGQIKDYSMLARAKRHESRKQYRDFAYLFAISTDNIGLMTMLAYKLIEPKWFAKVILNTGWDIKGKYYSYTYLIKFLLAIKSQEEAIEIFGPQLARIPNIFPLSIKETHWIRAHAQGIFPISSNYRYEKDICRHMTMAMVACPVEETRIDNLKKLVSLGYTWTGEDVIRYALRSKLRDVGMFMAVYAPITKNYIMELTRLKRFDIISMIMKIRSDVIIPNKWLVG